jgi:hypothetical protein
MTPSADLLSSFLAISLSRSLAYAVLGLLYLAAAIRLWLRSLPLLRASLHFSKWLSFASLIAASAFTLMLVALFAYVDTVHHPATSPWVQHCFDDAGFLVLAALALALFGSRYVRAPSSIFAFALLLQWYSLNSIDPQVRSLYDASAASLSLIVVFITLNKPNAPRENDTAAYFTRPIKGRHGSLLPLTRLDLILSLLSSMALAFALGFIASAADDHYSAGFLLQINIDFVLTWTCALLLMLLVSDNPRTVLGLTCALVALRYIVGFFFFDERTALPISLFFLSSLAAFLLLRTLTAVGSTGALGPFRPAALPKRTKFFAACAIIAAFVPADKLSIYHPYAYAIAWHCFHGNHTEIAGHRVTLPLLWWKEKSHTDYDTYLLRRASPANPIAESEILVGPEKPQDILDTDEKVLKNRQDSIASVNSNPHRFSPWTLVVVHPTAFTLYCTRATFGMPSLLITNVSLFCEATRLPYSFNFRGSGYGKTPIYEPEAISILSSLD